MAGRPVRFKGGFVFNVLTTLGLASSSFGEWQGCPAVSPPTRWMKLATAT